MGFMYTFVTLNDFQLGRRRELLDLFASIAQYSGLAVPIVIYFSHHLRSLAKKILALSFSRHQKERQSPTISRFRQPRTNPWTTRLRVLNWYLDDELFKGWNGWGTKREWMVAGVWTLWLLGLVFVRTGDDYLHMTRRFGIVAASQLPLHYLLAAKSWSPIQYLTRMSHEQLNPYHRLLGRIIIAFFSAHAALYANFYIQSNLLHRFGSQTVILGLTAISILHMLGISSLAKIREYSYLLFFVLHVVLSIVLLPVLWFHVRHIRVYIVESALMYLLIIIQRKVSQTPTLATLSLLPSTPDAHALLTVSIPLPINKFRVYRPGQHIYLSLPPTDPSKPWEKLRFNPFTIASTSSEPNSTSTVSTTATTQPTSGNAKTPSLTLLIRPLRSSTARLASLARTSNAQPVPVILEGPYGSSTYFPDLASESFSRILLVAGGVGATFTLPIYRDLMARRRGRGVSMVWAVRREEEAKALLKAKGEGVEIYVTGKGRGKEEERSRVDHSHTEADDNAVELEERAGLLGHVEGSAQEDVVNQAEGASSDVKYGRPNPSIIADEVFESEDEGGKVAVLLCGPAGIGRELRREVGRFVKRGREVFWHEEEFSW